MTGPEHYRAAELLLRSLDEERQTTEDQTLRIAQAQAHATLALAAATAAPQATTWDGDEDHSRSRGWSGAIS